MTKQDQAAELLNKHNEYLAKARIATRPGIRAAFEAVAREYLQQASEHDPIYVAQRCGAAE